MTRKRRAEGQQDQEPVSQPEAPAGEVENTPYGAPIYRDFDDFWAKKSRQLGLPSGLKRVLRAHFVAAGFNAPGKFEEGLRHYGL